MEVGIKQAKNELSRLFERAMRGETVVITKQGKGKVRLVPVLDQQPAARLGYGMFKGKIKLPPG